MRMLLQKRSRVLEEHAIDGDVVGSLTSFQKSTFCSEK